MPGIRGLRVLGYRATGAYGFLPAVFLGVKQRLRAQRSTGSAPGFKQDCNARV